MKTHYGDPPLCSRTAKGPRMAFDHTVTCLRCLRKLLNQAEGNVARLRHYIERERGAR